MAPFGFGKKNGAESQQPFITDITDGEDLEEIKKICHMLNPNEEVFCCCQTIQTKTRWFKIYSKCCFRHR